jgi:hypothetical protein
MERGAVGLIEGSLKNERNAETLRQGSQSPGHHHRMSLVLDDAWAGNDKEGVATPQPQLAYGNLMIHRSLTTGKWRLENGNWKMEIRN